MRSLCPWLPNMNLLWCAIFRLMAHITDYGSDAKIVLFIIQLTLFDINDSRPYLYLTNLGIVSRNWDLSSNFVQIWLLFRILNNITKRASEKFTNQLNKVLRPCFSVVLVFQIAFGWHSPVHTNLDICLRSLGIFMSFYIISNIVHRESTISIN